MIFCGDIALPYKGAIYLKDFPTDLRNSLWIGNLEGTLLRKEKESVGVNNDIEAVEELISEIPLRLLFWQITTCLTLVVMISLKRI